MTKDSNKVRIWDAPTRLFHWSLVSLMSISFYTGLSGGFVEMDYHMLSGYSILTLVLFRILWGFFGGYYARFTTFIKGPRRIFQHATSLLKKQAPYPGHNPLGALSIITILLSLLLQASTGLFANDDIMLEGPLVHLVSYDTSRMLTAIHKTNIWIIATLTGLHLAAVSFYQFYKKDYLIAAIFTGKKQLGAVEAPPSHLLRELLLGGFALALSAGAVYVIVNYL
jgi:cytochrome b